MIKDITLGQYYSTKSFLHSLDPRTKIALTFSYLLSLFLFQNFIGYFLAFLYLGMMIALSGVPLKYMLRGMRSIFVLLLFTVVLNLFFTPGELLASWWIFKISREGLRMALLMGLRLSFLIVGSSIMTFTTTPSRLTDGLERVMLPLKFIGVPVHEIAMMLSIALRFIPILADETDKIMKAQISRGADFESGGIVKKVKGLVPLLVPLFVSAFRSAGDLAMAMEVRCYRGGDGRTKLNPLKYKKSDALMFAVMVLYVVVGKLFLVFLKSKGIDF